MIAIAGILLIIPGFVSDIVGLTLFIRPVREFGWRLVRERIGTVRFAAGGRPRDRSDTIDLDSSDFTSSRRPNTPGSRLN